MTTDDLVVEAVRETEGYTVRWSGELDLLTAPRAVDSVARLDVAAGDTVRLVLDGVTFIDSTGVRALLEARQRVRQCRGEFVLADPSRQVVKVLALTGLAELLDMDDTPPKLAG